MSGTPDVRGSLPDDAGLGRLLADGLGRASAAPVDERELLAGAHRGAGRIRRRRRAALGVATVLVLAAPVGLFTNGFLRQATETTAGSAASAESADSQAAGAVAAAPSAPEDASGLPAASLSAAGTDARRSTARDATAGPVPAPGQTSAPVPATAPTDTAAVGSLLASPGPVAGPFGGGSPSPVTTSPAPQASSKGVATASRTTAGQVVVPRAVLPVAADLPAVTLRLTSDTANRTPAGALSAADTCGTALAGRPVADGSRAVALEHRTGAVASSWLLAGTVRVFASDGATRYLTAADRLGCTRAVAVTGADGAFVGRGAPDAQGRTHWYGVVRVGRAVTEVRLVVPPGARLGEADVVRLTRLAGDRLIRSGFAATVASDPDLR